ncbi:hypothetical protein SAMN05216167_1461 [Spirosoma endophyticum]|uniref:Uncharacterized protein n=1 Tax=Spirosoma endophyticum TaxID=662367 RepID=A0A1I2HNV4_9BACT|nr:hypothetical protein SAMN05216167_1461 [Spirosoma endophyticum]
MVMGHRLANKFRIDEDDTKPLMYLMAGPLGVLE